MAPKRSLRGDAPIIVHCAICNDRFDLNDPATAKALRRPCLNPHCCFYQCVDCLGYAFTLATKDTTQMPPTCCHRVIPLHVAESLSEQEKSEYRLKFSEWSTPVHEKLYCPVPSCSAFISLRQLKVPRCPDCKTLVCRSCHSFAHTGRPCPDTELASTRRLVETLGYKLCPGCGCGTRRMVGCAHLQCPLCGLHWCWNCMKAVSLCSGEEKCDDEDEEIPTEAAGNETLHQHTQMNQAAESQPAGESSEHNSLPDLSDRADSDFGPAPDELDMIAEMIVPYCKHDSAHFVEEHNPEQEPLRPAPDRMECHFCWKPISPGRYGPRKEGVDEARLCGNCGVLLCKTCYMEGMGRVMAE